MESQSGELLQPPEGVEDGPVGQLVTVEVEQPGGGISSTSAVTFTPQGIEYLIVLGRRLGGSGEFDIFWR